MDPVALQILEDELKKDGTVMAQAAARAREMLEETSPGHLAACGYELNRFYNILEKAFERVTETFENHFEKRGDYHERLIGRMNLEIQDVRPAFLPDELLPAVRELKGFRHIFRHAYDLELDPGRLAPLVDCAGELSTRFDGLREWFIQRARTDLSSS